MLVERSQVDVETVLELGSGGGNNASHLKQHFALTLVDRSEQMLDVSSGLNPECEHIEGDMRTVRLDRTFDGVFVHDALAYIVTEPDLEAVFETALSTAARAEARSSSRTTSGRRSRRGRSTAVTIPPTAGEPCAISNGFERRLRKACMTSTSRTYCERTATCASSTTSTSAGCSRRKPGFEGSRRRDSTSRSSDRSTRTSMAR